jgi:plasmid replication initiation protein
MNEVVKYHNDFNTATLRKWSEREMNVLFAVIARVKEKSSATIVLDFGELRKLSNFGNVSTIEFVDELFEISKKLGTLNYTERVSRLKGKVIILFSEFDIDGETGTLTVQVNEDFEKLFNRLGVFTTFELAEFVRIQSTYAKTVYRLLKQFRTQGWWQISIEDFRELLIIPENYKSGNVDQKVLKPILEQLGGPGENAIFKNLQVEKIKKKGRGRGGVLTGYKFKFDKEKTSQYVENKYANQAKPTKKAETAQAIENEADLRTETAADKDVIGEWLSKKGKD